jgi:hypothetical protein
MKPLIKLTNLVPKLFILEFTSARLAAMKLELLEDIPFHPKIIVSTYLH